MHEARLSWYVGLDAEATGIGDRLGTGKSWMTPRLAAWSGLFRLTFRDPDVMIERVRREPVYLILAMDQDKVLRMKPQTSSPAADPAPGARLMSAPRQTIAVGVIVERVEAQSQWIEHVLAAGRGVAGTTRTAPWTMLNDEGDRAAFYAGPATVRLHHAETAHYKTNLQSGRAFAVGGAARNRL